MNLSKNFTLEELVHSDTALANHIDNTPSAMVLENLTRVARTLLQPIRDAYGKAILVTSGYRCKTLNDKVGGSKTSQHLTGCAVDIQPYDRNLRHNRKENLKLFTLIEKMIKDGRLQVGQLIDEYNGKWTHVSLPSASKQNQILHLTK